MKNSRLLILFTLILCGFLYNAGAQVKIIQPYAGNGSGFSSSGDLGPATAAGVVQPYGLAADASNNVYIAESGGNKIRRVDGITGIITSMAGQSGFGGAGSTGDGAAATAAKLSGPTGVALDASGNLYIADAGNNRIRVIDAATGNIDLFAGSSSGFSGDGFPATLAQLNSPRGVIVDAFGNVFIADASNNRIRVVDVVTHNINTIAGITGGGGFSGDGPASTNKLNSPRGMAFDAAGNLYIADLNNNRVRKIDFSTGIMTTVAGNGTGSSTGDATPATAATINNPIAVSFDASGNLYIVEASGNKVRMVNTSGIISSVVGTGSGGSSGNGGLATLGRINQPGGMAFLNNGNYVVSERSGNFVRLIRNNDDPQFVRSTHQNITGCQGVATVLNTPLSVIDSDLSQTLTWNLVFVSTNGSNTPSATANTNGGTATPGGGGLSYTPGGAYTGNDSFVYSVSDGFTTVYDTVYINIIPNPIAGTITGPSSVCASGTTITLSDGSAGGTWSSSNANASIGSSSGIVNGFSAGTSVITYTNTNVCLTVFTTATLTVNPQPNAGVIVGPTTVCTGTSITLSDGAPGGTWGSSNTARATVTGGIVDGLTNGSPVINYTVTNMCGTAVATSTISVISVIPPGTITGPSTVCIGANSTLSDANAGGAWTASNSNAFVSGGVVTGLTAGTVNISYSFSNFCGNTQAVRQMTVLPLADPGTITGPSSVCLAASITLSDIVGGGVWGALNSSAMVTGNVATGIYGGIDTVTYAVTNTCGTVTAIYPINVIAIPSAGTISGPVSTCAGSMITLFDPVTGGVWSTTNSTASVSATGDVTGLSGGIDTVVYTVTYTCGSDAASFPVTINPLADAGIISGTANGCIGTTVTLTDPMPFGVWSSSNARATVSTSGAVTGVSAGAVVISYNVTNSCGTATTTKSMTINPVVSASLTTAASPSNLLCSVSSPVTIIPTPVNGGSAPSYQWFVNGAPVAGTTTYSFSPASGDVVKCKLTSNALCAIPDTASATVTISIVAPRTPSATIAVGPNDTVCSPSVVAFTVTPTNGGTTPIYQWNKNGVNVASGPMYGTVPVSGDVVYCVMTSNLFCVTSTTVATDPINMQVETPSANTITTTVTKSVIWKGTVDTFVAVAPHAGSAPSYQWYINGHAVAGANSTTYITDSLKPGQVVTCSVNSSDVCVMPHTIASAGITVLVHTGVEELATGSGLTLLPNPNGGTFTIKGMAGTANEAVAIQVTNMMGQVVYKASATLQNGLLHEQISLGNEVANGLYLVQIITDGQPQVIKFSVNR